MIKWAVMGEALPSTSRRTRWPRPHVFAGFESAFGAFGVYLVAALALFGRPLLEGGHACACVASTTDAGVYAWAFAWWPHALLHGLNPFFTHLLYAPQGINLAHGALVPSAALIFAPVTAIAGPLFAFNLAVLLSPVLASFFAFLLCRRLTRAWWPSLLGGWLFGFSTYLLGQLAAHLNLTLVFLVPAIVHLVLRAIAADIGRRRFVVLLVIALVVQFGFSVEVLASFTLFGAVALAVAYALGDAGLRARLRSVLRLIGLSYLVTALVVSPYLYYALQAGGEPILTWRTNMFSTDLLSFVVPTRTAALGGIRFVSTSRLFTAGYVESGAYLGIPLIVIALLAVRAGWRRTGVRVMLVTFLSVFVCTLGAHLHVGGSSGIELPWALVDRLPILGLMLPARFMLYGVLIVSVLVAMWLAERGPRVSAWLLALAAVAFLAPAIGRGYWRSTPDLPSLFTSRTYRDVISPRDTALVLPVGIAGQSMLWQAAANLRFTMASGYVVPPEAPDPYSRYRIHGTLTYGTRVRRQQAAAATFLASHHVTVAVLSARGAPTSPWVAILRRLGWRSSTVDGALVLRP